MKVKFMALTFALAGTVSLSYAAPQLTIKTAHTDFYDNGNYLFSIVQEWELTTYTGEPTPLPMIIRQYVYSSKMGLELLSLTMDGKPLHSPTSDYGSGDINDGDVWFDKEKWSQFMNLSNVAVDLSVSDDGSVFVEGGLSAWMIAPHSDALCKMLEICPPKFHSATYSQPLLEINKCTINHHHEYPLNHMHINVVKSEAMNINSAVADSHTAGKVFTQTIDISTGAISRGRDGSLIPMLDKHGVNLNYGDKGEGWF